MMAKMKDSGVEWIGEIPEGWEVNNFKKFALICNGSDASAVVDEEGVYPIMGSGGEIGRSSTFIYDKPSVLLGRKGTIDKPIFITEPFWTIDTMFYTAIRKNSFPKFFFYLCLSIPFDIFKSGSTIPSMTARDLYSINFPSPPISDQQKISAYLDHKCAQIDAVLAIIQQSIENLKEYRQAAITQAVTKGLDPDARLKDSGIEWIGEIPEEWRISSINKEFINLDNKRQPVSAENRISSEVMYDYYGASGVIDKINDYIFDEPLILIGEDGANLLLRNLPIIYTAYGKYWVNNHAHVLKPISKNHLSYMAYQLELLDLNEFLTGSTQPKLTRSNLSRIPVICPDLQTQQKISSFLDHKCAQIDALISEKQKLHDKFTAYKKSLIYEYVTGKREVANDWKD